jgi:hypothetical protein
MTQEQIKSVALDAMNRAIQNLDEALKTVRSSGQGGAIQYRLADAKLALEDLVPAIENSQ